MLIPAAGVKIGLTLIVAAVSFYLIERPFLKLKDRFEPGKVGSVKKPRPLAVEA
jgi:peptidoglycan/LPS O-acetylase OafA/YrhL